MQKASGGEIFVPKIPSYNLIDLAKAIMPKSKIKFVGIRPGEKLHEEMISFSESINSVIFDKYYVILPTSRDYKIKDYIKKNGGKEVTETFEYRSDTNKDFLSVKKIQNILRDYINY
jgi:UDP-N-acetylglucosamine 4,6-dehydratase